MTAIETLLRQPAAQAVGWALLQFVWQGAVVGALTALALLALRRSASDVRYVVVGDRPRADADAAGRERRAEAAGAAGRRERRGRGPGAVSRPGRRTRALKLTAVRRRCGPCRPAERRPAAGPPRRCRARPRRCAIERLLPTLILIWIAGVSLLSLRLLTGWIWVQRLRARGNAPAADAWQQMATRLSRRLHIRRAITLLESTLVDVPTVIGWLKPVVLLPASALAALSPQQLEAILAHELAHIRRHDYLVNLLQTLVETLLFYHPAVWWLSRRIRIERENCCDDLAVSLCGDPVAYASALADLESLRSETAPTHHIAMAATGGSLLQRIRRLLGAPSSHSGRGPAWLAGSVALLLIGGIALGADGLARDQVRPRPAVAPAKAVLAQAASSADATTPAVAPARAQAIDAQRAQDLAVVAAVRARATGSSEDRAALAAAEADIARIANASAAPVIAAPGAPVASAAPAIAPVESTLALVAAIASAPGTNQSVSMSHHSDDQIGHVVVVEQRREAPGQLLRHVRVHRRRHRRAAVIGRRLSEDFRRRVVVRAPLGRDPRARRPAGSPLLRQRVRAAIRARRAGVAAREPAEVRAQHRHRRAGARRALPEVGRRALGDGGDLPDRQRLRQGHLLQGALQAGDADAGSVPAGDDPGVARDEERLRAGVAAHLDRRPAAQRRDVARRLFHGRRQHLVGLRAAPRLFDDVEARAGEFADALRNPHALGHNRLRLRAVGAAAPDHVAADARRPQPRGVLQERIDPEQRLRAASRAEDGHRTVA